MKRIALMAILFFIPALARADSVWEFNSTLLDGTGRYDGMKFIDGPSCNCYLNGTVIVDDSYNLLAWNFTDGTRRLTQLNSAATFSAFQGGYNAFTDEWQFSFTGGDWRFDSRRGYGDGLYAVVNDWNAGTLIGTKGEQVGGWSEVGSTAAPEPGSLLLLGVGVIGLLFASRFRM